MRAILLFLSFSFLTAPLILGREPLTVSPDFIKDRGEISIISGYSFYRTSHFWNRNGRKRPAFDRLINRNIDFYLEYGLTCADTLGFYSSYMENREDLNGNKRGLEDVEISWKHYLTNLGQFALSSRLIGIIPTRFFPDKRSFTTIRYGRIGAEFDLHLQRNFCLLERPGWFETLVGYRYYDGSPSDLVKANAIIGYDIFPRIRIIGSAFLDYGVYNGNEPFRGLILNLPPRYRLLKTQIHGVFAINQYTSFYLGSYQHVWGQEIGSGVGYFGGLWLDF